jgi:hypothetical protein
MRHGMPKEDAEIKTMALDYVGKGRFPHASNRDLEFITPADIRGPKGKPLAPDFAAHVYAMWQRGIRLDVSRLLADGYGKRKAATRPTSQ